LNNLGAGFGRPPVFSHAKETENQMETIEEQDQCCLWCPHECACELKRGHAGKHQIWIFDEGKKILLCEWE
jgi:hypothetical protein